ncbi:PaaI family thioesterase [Neobacillus dielmonensis]|uniref:PaaI family thioesterase n=1 Tax=Neobacillus dielmonensis TaxID=1347369 RepID=UPI0005A74F01|nr:PaaI family thioesterase [Neobacillus dielmonensis]
MKDELRQLLETCMENGTELDLKAIKFLLEGVQNKISKHRDVYIADLLHMESHIDKDSCEITIPVNPVLNNNLKIVHGGITATLLDTVMGSLANYQLPEGYGAVTNQLNIHYIAPGGGDFLNGKAKIIHRGTKTMVVEGDVFRSDGKKIAHATGTFFVVTK